jgi:hypothetical protein
LLYASILTAGGGPATPHLDDDAALLQSHDLLPLCLDERHCFVPLSRRRFHDPRTSMAGYAETTRLEGPALLLLLLRS